MKKLIPFLFIVPFTVFAGPSRAPAVLDGSCDLSVSPSIKEIKAVMKEQCRKVKNCMNSADEADMKELKNMEAISCNNDLKAITIKSPAAKISSDFDGKREAKPNAESFDENYPQSDTSGTVKK